MGKLNDNERFKHVDYQHTDLKTTFARIRKEQAQAEKARLEQDKAKVETLYNVYPSLRPLRAVK